MALVAGVVGAAVCAWIASGTGTHQGVWIFAAAMSGATALVAAIDLGVIRHRMHERILRAFKFPHPR